MLPDGVGFLWVYVGPSFSNLKSGMVQRNSEMGHRGLKKLSQY